jgi:N-acetylmuramoyl-L-alanine amidase
MVAFLIFSMSGMMAVYWFFSPVGGDAEVVATAGQDGLLTAPFFKPMPAKPVTQRVAQSPGPIRIGIIAGHKGNDSGAVCDDGLTEAEVTANIATQVMAALQSRGVRVDLLDEFDPRLQGYSATGLVSIHADSCTFVNTLATGFKVAGSSYSDSSRLSICVEQAYREATQLPYHANTITPHMTDYHAFREIASGVPAIIIEVGFLFLDREIVTTNADIPVTGLTNGILCFLGQED